jgi:hypothetical protein
MSDNLSSRENTMMRLTRTHRTFVSNRLAVLAAFLLVAAAAAGINGSMNDTAEAGPALAASQPANDNAMRATGPQPAKANKRFKLSFYLFRRD